MPSGTREGKLPNWGSVVSHHKGGMKMEDAEARSASPARSRELGQEEGEEEANDTGGKSWQASISTLGVRGPGDKPRREG